MMTDNITLRLEQLPEGWFLWGENDNKKIIEPYIWQHDAFTWHSTTFFGTFVKEIHHDRKNGFFLTSKQALEFVATMPHNSFSLITYDPELTRIHEQAQVLWTDFTESSFIPDMDRWNDEVAWTSHQAGKLEPMLSLLFSQAINETLQSEEPQNEEWERAARLFEHPYFAKKLLTIAVNEADWLTKIGYLEDDLPFTIGLRLLEPQEEFELWKLETILQPKRGQKTYVFTDEASLPKRWKNYYDNIIQTYNGWEKLVPWLIEEGDLRHELYESEAWKFLTEASNELLAAGVDILLPSWWQQLKATKFSLRAKVKADSKSNGESFFGMNTIVEFDWRISTEGAEFSEDEFRSLMQQNRHLLNINGQWIKLDPEFIERMKKLMNKAERRGLEMKDLLQQELLRGTESQQVNEDENPFSEIEIELDAYYENVLSRLTEVGNIPSRSIPENLHAELRPYQHVGIEWLLYLRDLGFGALLADDMGLGKTLTTIAYLLYIKEHGLAKGPALVIAPTSVLGNWQKEFERFAPDLSIGLYYGANRDRGEHFLPSLTGQDVILTSYALANLDSEELSSYKWSSVIIDEAQNIKNSQTKQSRAVRKLDAWHKVALTGTPMENRLSELWAIFDFLNRGYLGSLSTFQSRFVAPIEKDRDEAKIQQLKRLISPFLLRRTKQDPDVALNLPDKQEQKEYCALTTEQAALYEQMVQDTLTNVKHLSGIERRGFILLMLNKLKQICNHPALYLKEEQPKHLIERSMKMQKLLELIDTIHEQGESCLIFTQYIRMGNMLKQLLEAKTGKPVLFLNGSIRKADRDKMINGFQSGEYSTFILSLKAGGTGLNLTAANHVIHYDRWWNPAVENQATDRAYRIGQKRFVHVHKLISSGTLEEKIDEMLEKKQSLNDAIITSDNWITELTTDELKDLLGVG
ncbi:DEAD/DEAH box helicase [Ectobacillus sp. sgz5001026]|uniref:DEAD/DEAH box helicase n=1 Tax=Ectobacillus sp. sgz5001026 TaxID=3242473 RepID=UPI0036D3B68D